MKNIIKLILFFLISININAIEVFSIQSLELESRLNKITKDTSTGEVNVAEINADTINANVTISTINTVGDITLDSNTATSNSPKVIFIADNTGTKQESYLRMVYGANPYFRIAMDTQQTGNLTTMDFSESTITPFVNDVTSLGTSSSKFNNVYANYFYGDGSNLTNILTTYDTTLLFDLVEDTTGATYWEIKASYYELTNFDSYCYSFEITDTTTHAGETNIYVIRESEDISFNEDKTSIIFRSTLRTYYTNYLKGKITEVSK